MLPKMVTHTHHYKSHATSLPFPSASRNYVVSRDVSFHELGVEPIEKKEVIRKKHVARPSDCDSLCHIHNAHYAYIATDLLFKYKSQQLSMTFNKVTESFKVEALSIDNIYLIFCYE